MIPKKYDMSAGHPIRFPEDEQAHDTIIEWWYLNGNLYDEKGNRYSYMHTLFRADNNRVAIPYLKRLPFARLHFAHSILSDVKKKKSYPQVDNVVITSTDSFTRPLLYINYTQPGALGSYFNNEIMETKPFSYQIKSPTLRLTMTSKKAPLLEGGKGFLDLNGRRTYYYSLTRLETEGTVILADKEVAVKGLSWMDHQWADTPYAKDEWTWFSLQMDDGTDIVCCRYRWKGGESLFADVSWPDGTQAHAEDITLTPLDREWTSAVTGTNYPLEWRVDIPSLDMSLHVQSPLEEQEVLFGAINYWEGPLDVRGAMRGKKAKGIGFLELVGYGDGSGTFTVAKRELKKAVDSAAKQWRSFSRA